jgi:1-acyl-sn-glycerol-3-phosphate acyltransferase
MADRELIHKIHVLWRVPLILVVTGLLSTMSVFFSIIDSSGRLQHWCAQLWARFIFSVSRVTVEVEGLEKLQPGRGYVFMANHLSMFDHWAFLSFVPFQIRFAAKASLFKIPFLGWHLRRSGNLPVHFRNPRQTLRSYQEVAERIRAGTSFVIYPEGMRTLDGVTVPFKRGAFLLPKHAQAPIVPVTLTGAHRRLQRGSMVIRSGRMGMIIHEPIEFDEYRDLELQALADRVRDIILSRYELQ